MRDPAASLVMEAGRVVRRLRQPLDDDHFLRSALAQQWVERGDLVPFEIAEPYVVIAKRLPFVTHPYEWCALQLFRAGELTLKLQQEAVQAGYDLKDASAWNIIFDGTRPVFCDLLSFERLHDKKWWAAGQFARHFIFPLLLSGRRGLSAHECFMAWRDGVPEETTRHLLGRTRFLTRYWPLMASAKSDGAAVDRQGKHEQSRGDAIPAFRASLHGALSWMLKGVDPAAQRQRTIWRDYVSERSHYDDEALERKRETVRTWLTRCQPEWVLDLGCNSGEFSRMAVELSAKTIAVDADHGALQRIFEQSGQEGIYPVLARLDDLQGGRGWAGGEHPGLIERLNGSADVVLMLALVHHLAIGAAIPLGEIACLAKRCTRRWLIVELLASSDPQVSNLCRQRARDSAEFDIGKQMEAFLSVGWELRSSADLCGGQRKLCLMERSEAGS